MANKLNRETNKLQKNLRKYNVSSISIQDCSGGLFENKAAVISNNIIDLFIIFCPIFGSMDLYDGNFLKDKIVYIIILKSIFPNTFKKPFKHDSAILRVYYHKFAKEINYQFSNINYKTQIIDFNKKLLINIIPLSNDQLPLILMMEDKYKLAFGHEGPIFDLIYIKDYIKINLNKSYFLRGDFNFLYASYVHLENVISDPVDGSIFFIKVDQHFILKNIRGLFNLLMSEININITFDIDRIENQALIYKDENLFNFTSNISLDDIFFAHIILLKYYLILSICLLKT